MIGFYCAAKAGRVRVGGVCFLNRVWVGGGAAHRIRVRCRSRHACGSGGVVCSRAAGILEVFPKKSSPSVRVLRISAECWQNGWFQTEPSCKQGFYVHNVSVNGCFIVSYVAGNVQQIQQQMTSAVRSRLQSRRRKTWSWQVLASHGSMSPDPTCLQEVG